MKYEKNESSEKYRYFGPIDAKVSLIILIIFILMASDMVMFGRVTLFGQLATIFGAALALLLIYFGKRKTK